MTAETDPTAPTVSSAAGEPGEERLAPGDKAGEYVIEAHAGAGAMGDVYRALQPVIGKQVAIKVIKRKLAGSAEALERFVREARAVNKINHPNVVDVFAMGRLADGRLWLAMNYLDGESLGRHLRKHGPMTPPALYDVLRPVCEALAAAHGQGVVHRDLKSDNIFLTKSATGEVGRVYVLDFGIAKVLADVAAETGARQSLTSEGAWIGTPAYMAPEQWTAEGASARSDVYALGIVAYEMLSGRPPFMGTSLPAIMEQHFRAEVPALSTPSGGLRVPAELEAAIGIALAKKPEERPESALAFLGLVEQALGNTGTGTRPRGLGVAGTAHTVRSARAGDARRRRVGLALAAGVGVVGAGALGLLLLGGGKQDKPGAGPSAVESIHGDKIPVMVRTEPPGAQVSIGGEKLAGDGTPTNVFLGAGETKSVRIDKLGYDPEVQELTGKAGAKLDLTLTPIRGFEGTWRIPNGELRYFEHAGESVTGYQLDAIGGERKFLRRFGFAQQSGASLSFTATLDEVFEGRPNEPSCHIALATEYRYDMAEDRLEQRRQRVHVALVEGKCRPQGEIAWSSYEPVARLTRGAESTVIESRAGSGNPSLVNALTPGNDVPEVKNVQQQAKDEELDPRTPDKGGTKDKPTKAPPTKEPPKKAVQKEPVQKEPVQKEPLQKDGSNKTNQKGKPQVKPQSKNVVDPPAAGYEKGVQQQAVQPPPVNPPANANDDIPTEQQSKGVEGQRPVGGKKKK